MDVNRPIYLVASSCAELARPPPLRLLPSTGPFLTTAPSPFASTLLLISLAPSFLSWNPFLSPLHRTCFFFSRSLWQALLSQYSYYRWCWDRRRLSELEVASEESSTSHSTWRKVKQNERLLDEPGEKDVVKPPAVLLSIVVIIGLRAALMPSETAAAAVPQLGRVLLAVESTDSEFCDEPSTISEAMVIVGEILSWLSGIIYICGRIPQLLTNRAKRSVEGLSAGLFIITVLGNILYGLSVILHGQLPWLMDDSSKFWKSVFPYLLGSIGTLVFDFAILGQFALYRGTKVAELRTSNSDHLGLTSDDAAYMRA